MNPATQGELFTDHRYHAVLTNSPLPTLDAEKARRAHAIAEQIIVDLKNGPSRPCRPGTSGATGPG